MSETPHKRSRRDDDYARSSRGRDNRAPRRADRNDRNGFRSRSPDRRERDRGGYRERDTRDPGRGGNRDDPRSRDSRRDDRDRRDDRAPRGRDDRSPRRGGGRDRDSVGSPGRRNNRYPTTNDSGSMAGRPGKRSRDDEQERGANGEGRRDSKDLAFERDTYPIRERARNSATPQPHITVKTTSGANSRQGSLVPEPASATARRNRPSAADFLDDEAALPAQSNDRMDVDKKASRYNQDEDDDNNIIVEEGDSAAQMAALMGFGGFGTTKQKKVPGNDVGAVRKEKKTEYRQYMNRVGGFNRPLDEL